MKIRASNSLLLDAIKLKRPAFARISEFAGKQKGRSQISTGGSVVKNA